MKLLVTLVIIFSSHLCIAQNNYAAADSVAGKVKGENLQLIHAALVKNLNADEDKVRAFYSWIAHNILYDVNEWQNGKKSPAKQEPLQVLKSKKAVCYGYSSLFREFCKLSEITCYLVTGFTRINGKFNNEGHAWNIVSLEGKWKIIDVTWGAGSVDLRKKYIKKFTDDYFLPDPIQFLSDHYPLDPMWQLIEHPVKLTEYKIAKWEYSEKPGPVFSFNDTIATWESLDSLNKAHTSALRMVRYNPGDPAAQQELAYALFALGDAEFDKGTQLLTNLGSGNKKAKLDSVETYYKNADYYYRQVKLSDPAQKEVLKNNMEALKYNRNVLKEEQHNNYR